MRIATVATQERHRSRRVANSNIRTPRERLIELRQRSGLSVREMSRRMGYDSPGGYHRYEREETQADYPIPVPFARKLISIFVGMGQPPITADEIMALTELDDLPKSVRPHISVHGPLPLKYRIEGKGGAAVMGEELGVCCPSVQYPPAMQFAVRIRGSGEELHCVEPRALSSAAIKGRRVVVLGTGGAIAVVRATNDNGLPGRMVGVVIGAYKAE